MGRNRAIAWLCLAGVGALLASCSQEPAGPLQDEAKMADRTAASLAGADDDYFIDMDYGFRRNSDPSVKLSAAEVRGRNTWNVWTFGNDWFWDYMANHTFGALDLLKVVS